MRIIEAKNPEYRILSNGVLYFIGEEALFSKFRVASKKECDEYKENFYRKCELSKCSGYFAPLVQNPTIINETFFMEDTHDVNFSNEIIEYASEKGIPENEVEVLKSRDYIIVTSTKTPILYSIPLLIVKEEKNN